MAFGNSTFADAGAAVSDIFAYEGTKYKAQGDLIEGQNYQLAAQLAQQNEQFTEQSTAIKKMQTQREIELGLGTTAADVSGAGFSMSGSGLDIMRAGAAQGALQQSVLSQQGLITEAGYNEQATAYTNMAQAAQIAAKAETEAGKGDLIAGGINAVASLATLIPGGGSITGAISAIGKLFS